MKDITLQFEVPLADATTTGVLPTGSGRREVSGIGDDYQAIVVSYIYRIN